MQGDSLVDAGAYGRVRWLDDSVMEYETKEMFGRVLREQSTCVCCCGW